MEIIKPKIIVRKPMYESLCEANKRIEWMADGARIAYQSFEKKTGFESEERILRNCIKNGHTSVLEHAVLSYDFICDRGLSHELVRHRIASYTQESTRYVKYDDENMEFIRMIEFHPANEELITDTIKKQEQIWRAACSTSEVDYNHMMSSGAQAQTARSVLNNSLKTHIRITRNFRNMREFLILRCAPSAHPHAKELCIPLLLHLKAYFPCIFEDISYDEKFLKDYIGKWSKYIEIE